ncbi:hypothetical protein [Dietzia sp. 179-F 9C3 NHS]|uniref:hypothetical protein n=1 Tax=Dietzia sp. 179-F 9C3 NHS TaxID=3374295 RepID=UPI003879C17D
MPVTPLHSITGLRIDIDGSVTEHEVPVDGDSALDGMYAVLGVDTVDVATLRPCPGSPGRTLDAWVDDSGMLNSVPNWIGTGLAALMSDDHTRVLYGPILLLVTDERTGRSHSVPRQLRAAIGEAARLLGQSQRVQRQVARSVDRLS